MNVPGVRRAAERGYAALELVLGIGLLLFPTALVVVSLPGWSERQATATQIAQEGARLLATADDCAPDLAAVQLLGAEIAQNHGFSPGDFAIAVEGSSQPGGEVRVRVTAAMPVTTIPAVGTFGAWSWTASHAERVDAYRSC